MWDPYLRGDIDKLEQIQHRAARIITGDYRSTHPESVITMLTNLNLDTLDNRRLDQRLKYMYRTVRGSILALPTETLFRPQKTNKRLMKPKHFPEHVSSFFVQQLTTNNTRCFIVPTARTEQFQNFLVKTIADWIQLYESQVQAETITDFSRLICGPNTQ